MAEQTLEIRCQRGRVSRRTRWTRSSRSSRKTRSTTACNGQAREKAIIISRYTCAYAHTLQEFYVFCCHKCHTNTITHYVTTIYIDFRNNIPHCHTFTLLLHPQKSPKHHPQNNFSTSNLKQPVTFHKTTRCFL